MITGTAWFRERIALPPDAVFEAILEDVSRADAPSTEIGRTTIGNPPHPPIAFSIAYDPQAIDERLSYVVRTRILAGERLLFTSDTAHPVLTRGAPSDVTIMMRMVGRSAGAPDNPGAGVGGHGLHLPATFKGDLPCADCEGIRHHLNLWPDQAFMLRRTWLGTDEIRDHMGHWSFDAARRAISLWDVGGTRLELEVLDDRTLRLLDRAGRPIASDLPYELTAGHALELTDARLYMGGELVYMADAARLTECKTGRSFPVAMEGGWLQLERAYLDAIESPAQPLMVTFEGGIEERPRMEGGGTEPTAIVARFVGVWPGETCAHNRADSTLANTRWRIVKLGDEEILVGEGQREPHLTLRPDENRFSATVGCNQFSGGYETPGDNGLRFGLAAATMMACPPPLDRYEQALGKALAAVRTWHIYGQTLALADADGNPVALLRAIYLP